MSDAMLLELARRVCELESSVAQLEAGPAAPEPSGLDAEVEALVRSGNKIGAIKRYREITGVGLAEAKDAVEKM